MVTFYFVKCVKLVSLDKRFTMRHTLAINMYLLFRSRKKKFQEFIGQSASVNKLHSGRFTRIGAIFLVQLIFFYLKINGE